MNPYQPVKETLFHLIGVPQLPHWLRGDRLASVPERTQLNKN